MRFGVIMVVESVIVVYLITTQKEAASTESASNTCDNRQNLKEVFPPHVYEGPLPKETTQTATTTNKFWQRRHTPGP